MGNKNGVLMGRRAKGNCVLCQHKKRVNKRMSYCTAFGDGNREAILAYFRCRCSDPDTKGNAFKMIEGKKWR